MQVKKKSIALKETQDDSFTEESTNEDDDELAFVIREAKQDDEKECL